MTTKIYAMCELIGPDSQIESKETNECVRSIFHRDLGEKRAWPGAEISLVWVVLNQKWLESLPKNSRKNRFFEKSPS